MARTTRNMKRRVKKTRRRRGGAPPTVTLPGIWGRLKSAKQMGGAMPTVTLPGIWGRLKAPKQMGGSPNVRIPGVWGGPTSGGKRQMGGMRPIRDSDEIINGMRNELDVLRTRIYELNNKIAEGDTSPETQNELSIAQSQFNDLQANISSIPGGLTGAADPTPFMSTTTLGPTPFMSTTTLGPTTTVDEEDARRRAALIEMMKPVDKGTISDLSKVVNHKNESMIETYKLLNTSTGPYTMHIIFARAGIDGHGNPIIINFLLATQLSSVTAFIDYMIANPQVSTMSDKGSVSKIADLPTNASPGDIYTVGISTTMYTPGGWSFVKAPFNPNGNNTSLEIADIATLVGYPVPAETSAATTTGLTAPAGSTTTLSPEAEIMAAFIEMMKPVDKGSISNLSSLVNYKVSDDRPQVSFGDSFKLLNTSPSGGYTMFIIAGSITGPGSPISFLLIATKLPSVERIMKVMSENSNPNVMPNDKGSLSKIADLPTNVEGVTAYTIGSAVAISIPGYWLITKAPFTENSPTTLSLAEIATLVGYPAPAGEAEATTTGLTGPASTTAEATTTLGHTTSAQDIENMIEQMRVRAAKGDKGAAAGVAAAAAAEAAGIRGNSKIRAARAAEAAIMAGSTDSVAAKAGAAAGSASIRAEGYRETWDGAGAAAEAAGAAIVAGHSESVAAKAGIAAAPAYVDALAKADKTTGDGGIAESYAAAKAAGAKAAEEAKAAEVTTTAPTTTANTTTANTTTIEPTTTVSLTGPVAPPPGPPVTNESIKTIVESAKKLFAGIVSNPDLSESLKDLIGRAQYLVNSPQLQRNIVASINNLKKSAPAAAAVAEGFALLSLQFVKEPALLQILQALQSQYKNLMKPSLQNSVKDLIEKLVPLITPEVQTALNKEIDVFVNASLKDSNIANTLGHIAEDSSKIVSSAPVQAAVDSVTV